jgi:hypothetical protein
MLLQKGGTNERGMTSNWIKLSATPSPSFTIAAQFEPKISGPFSHEKDLFYFYLFVTNGQRHDRQ